MENSTRQELTKEQFSGLVLDPSSIRPQDADLLSEALGRYPYCQLLHAFQGRSVSTETIPQEKLFRAALISPDRTALKTILSSPEIFRRIPVKIETHHPVEENALPGNFSPAEDDRAGVIYSDTENLGSETGQSELQTELHTESGNIADGEETTYSDDPVPTSDNTPEMSLSPEPELGIDHPAEETDAESDRFTKEDENPEAPETQVTDADELTEPSSLEETRSETKAETPGNEEVPEIKHPLHSEYSSSMDEDEDEFDNPWDESKLEPEPEPDNISVEESAAEEMQQIIEPDLPEENSLDPEEAPSADTGVEQNDQNADPVIETEEEASREERVPELDELDFLIQTSAAEQYSLEDQDIPGDNAAAEGPVPSEEPDNLPEETPQVHFRFGEHVTRYNDEKMPYSFLWWLDKTRREHTENYQPYATSFRLDTSKSITRSSVDQLSSQIIENIFHLQSPVDELENSPRTVPFQVKRKGDQILEKFIKEEPQIRPPDSQKLDTENKARKSSEDPNDLVSETLAQIYTDQMLYHKAIDTYKKLSFKYPEKSTYFADQIVELEKKIN